ncbi:MAG: 4-(cytidine 5'-diphospho)-2-C-methyl-D-erythritol kinase [Nitrospirota bacterium]|nr:4-(cytidine 5'-diphospho)-2-C-methyl-D-erythritol kinase [Nitrospirota bacterium]
MERWKKSKPALLLSAPAKINWFLLVFGKRQDGYHNIMSLMQCIRLYDDLIFEHADTIEVESDSTIPVKDNLVYRAASLLKKYTSYKKGIKIIVKKNIPIGAGLGGGSSDAAYTLSGLNMVWGLELNNRDLSSIGAEIGSDVPFFLNSPVALVEGRGEKVSSLKIGSSVDILLVKPFFSISSAWAYKHVKELTKKTIDIKLFCQAVEKKDFASLGTMLNNDLEKGVVTRYPVVDRIKTSMRENGAVISAMSGSGPTVFGIFESKDRAKKAAKAMKPHWCRLVETII